MDFATMPKSDYSAYLQQNLEKTETDWLAAPDLHDAQAKAVKAFLFDNSIQKIVEVGCATGNLATRIPDRYDYLGIDAAPMALVIAQDKNPKKRFIPADVRQIGEPTPPHDLVICFAFMKHFALEEWIDVLKRVLSLGVYGIFDIPIAETPRDDGVEFPHLWLTGGFVVRAVELLGYRVLSIDKRGPEWILEVTRAKV